MLKLRVCHNIKLPST